MSADCDALLHKAKQLMATGVAMLHTMEALHRKIEKSIDDSHGRIDHMRELLTTSRALLQQAKASQCHQLPDKSMLHNQDPN